MPAKISAHQNDGFGQLGLASGCSVSAIMQALSDIGLSGKNGQAT